MELSQKIRTLCLEHYPRVAEIATGLSLVGLSSYVMDHRLESLGFALSPYHAAVVVCASVLFFTGVGQIAAVIGFGSFWREGLSKRRSEPWMQFGFRQEFYWRRSFAMLASIEWGVYAGALSGTKLASCLVGSAFILLMTASYVRLGLKNEWTIIRL
jgi:hypothetical protein